MQNINSWLRVFSVVCLLSFAVGCGQKGDLYLPDENAVASQTE